ncbi:MAG TPA: Type 1 glutamine amidotransferase-like domain-containing protein [Anaerolineales bacterium]|nr:Type 1 glutamine amidotransferase-like domain-containing protein [Anaerolineales bacterium]
MNRQTKIALAGGGGAEDSRLLDELFASWIGPEGQLLYLPIALRGIYSFESCYKWITGTFSSLNINRIKMWTDLSDHQAHELKEFAAIYIGGGNTYSLLAELLHSGFDRHLRDYAKNGGILYGGSAGAIVLGRDIRTAAHADPNEVGLMEVNCLNLANDHAIWPHYESKDDKLIEDFVQTYQLPVLAISERSGIVIESGEMRTVGFEPSYRFGNLGKLEV